MHYGDYGTSRWDQIIYKYSYKSDVTVNDLQRKVRVVREFQTKGFGILIYFGWRHF